MEKGVGLKGRGGGSAKQPRVYMLFVLMGSPRTEPPEIAKIVPQGLCLKDIKRCLYHGQREARCGGVVKQNTLNTL